MKYKDFTSLYPSVQKYCPYPVGHPNIVTENFGDVRKYFGSIKCKILPPKKLYFPVLPARINNKLLFTLCQTCAVEQKKKCNHSIEERCIDGTWISLEIQEALNQGYKIVELYEVWHWEKTSVYDKATKSCGLFANYVDIFLKGKQEADGYPDYFKND
ncbi:unnamed protein product [Brachionus calyciflorus]|uniref:DNA-directed DNA polymerase n=1 Tax=Brachionus calyciflorus TaxID=104777 RepID=A0A814HWG2_9BILA|nr:unnamed protein product [Brachionus calyciflorus]